MLVSYLRLEEKIAFPGGVYLQGYDIAEAWKYLEGWGLGALSNLN